MIEVSLIIPVLNDAPALDAALNRLSPIPDTVEIIVVDGGSRDDTSLRLETQYPAVHYRVCPPGRASQMNAGAQAASGNVLVFLHADTHLPGDWLEQIQTTSRKQHFAMGYFPFQTDGEGLFYTMLERAVALRCRFLNMPYGDQGLFLHRHTFEAVGGYSEMPLMEDVDLVRRVKKQGHLFPARSPAITSSRNWQQDGPWRRTLRNIKTRQAYRFGKDPSVWRSEYRGEKQAVAVFCKKPEAGKVKTRLAYSIGRTQAAEWYRAMVEETLRQTLKGRFQQTLICYSPSSEWSFFYHWLGPAPTYLPQAEGNLGDRMSAAVQEMLQMGATKATVIGTDCPQLNRHLIKSAFRKLDQADVVIGPSEDGGYYLIAMKAEHPELFADIDWSTEKVLGQTLEAADRKGLRVDLLPTLLDVDTLEDLKTVQNRMRAGAASTHA